MRFLILTASLALGCSGLCGVGDSPRVPQSESLPIVKTESGLVQGVPGEDESVLVFKGIPFAAPPVGPLRWRPPQPPEAWPEVRRAVEFSPSCTQALRRSYLPWTEEYMLRNDVSEDCLALNIWLPAGSLPRTETAQRGTGNEAADDASVPLPVYVYLHGGAYNSGSGEVLLYDGERLAKRGVIVVTLNYRLGVFGFFAHPELTAESEHDSSGNYGLMDQVAALSWVQRNIAAFGGDPQRVTLGGQSAGAGSVHLLTVSPLARGLFHGAIAQSGAWNGEQPLPVLQEAESGGLAFMQAAQRQSLEELRALPEAELYALYQEKGVQFRPIVDGWVVPDQVPAVYARGEQIRVPLLVGMMADERSSREEYRTASQEQKQAWRAEGLATLKSWREAHRAPALKATAPSTTRSKAAGTSSAPSDAGALRARAVAGPPPSFGYLFERAIPWPEHPEYQAFHSGELPYVFDNLSKMNRPWQELDHELAELSASYWVNFISKGDPNAEGLPAWPSETGQILRLGQNVRAADALLAR